jgi:hypothetical protein
VPLGRFLRAGKTTLILAAARLLRTQDTLAAAVLNDQGTELVDTRLIQENGLPADQVTGGCFCCRFSGLVDAVERLQAHGPSVIFARTSTCWLILAPPQQSLDLDAAADPARRREMVGGTLESVPRI